MQNLDIGKQLRDERHRLGKSLEEIHEETRVSVAHLQFLEDNNFTFLPGTYVKSFLKTYARSLGVDATELLSAYEGVKAPPRPEPEPEAVIGGDLTDVPEPKKTERPAQRVDYVLPIRQLVEWSIGVGALAVLVAVVVLYIEFRSQIYAAPPDHLTYRETHHAVDMAHVSLLSADAGDSLAPSLQLMIVPSDQVWIELKVDGAVSEHRLAPGISRSWLARERFDVRIGRLVEHARPQAQPDSVDRQSVVGFSLTRDHL